MSEYQQFLSHIKTIEDYRRIWKRLDYDRQCNAPIDGLSICGTDASIITCLLEEAKKDPEYIKNRFIRNFGV